MGSWSSVMSPYEQWFVDVKFVVDLKGFVTVTLKEGGCLHLYLHFHIPCKKRAYFEKKKKCHVDD